VAPERGNDGLEEAVVVRAAQPITAAAREQDEDAEHQQRWQDADGEEVAWMHEQCDADADHHEADVEEHADPATDHALDHGDREGERDPERDDTSARLRPLVPDGPRHLSLLTPP